MVRTTDLFVWSRVSADFGRPPPPSCCQSMVAFKGRLYVFGGAVLGSTYNDVFSFDLATSTWSYEDTQNSELATSRMSHTAVMYNGTMYVYGGMDTQVIHSDMLALDLTTMVWSNVPCESGAHPGCRRSHASVVHKDKMYMMMGLPSYPPPDLWAFDFPSRSWAPLTTTQRFGVPPVSVHGHTMAVDNDRLYMFGGSVQGGPGAPSTYFNKLYSYRVDDGLWSEISVAPSPCPSPRYSHVMVADRGSLYIHGGDSNNCTTYFDDLWSIDVSGDHEPRWALFQHTGPLQPCARSGHCAVVESGALFIFGGEAPGEDDTTVYYSGQLYRFPITLCLELPLLELCSRWLSRAMKPADMDELFTLTPNSLKVLKRYLPLGRKENLCEQHM